MFGMPWQVVTILTGLISGSAQVVGKRQVHRMSAFQSGLLRDFASFVVVSLLILWGGSLWLDWRVALIVILGLLEAVGMAAYFAATREHMSATVVFSYPLSQVLIVLSAGAFFSEWRYFDPRHFQGAVNISALVLTLLLLTGYQGGRVKGGKLRWSWLLVMSASVVAVSNIVVKWAVSVADISPVDYLFYEYVGLLLGGSIFLYGRGKHTRLGKHDLALGIVQGVLAVTGAIVYMSVLRFYPLSLASILRRVTIVMVTMLSGFFVFGERKGLTRGQWVRIGLGIVVFGLVMAVNR